MRPRYHTIIAKNIEESVKYYHALLGLEVVAVFMPNPDTKIVMLQGEGDSRVELIENPAFPTGLYSVGMEVEDLDATLATLREKNAVILAEPSPIQNGRIAFAEDPNGARIALIQHDPE